MLVPELALVVALLLGARAGSQLSTGHDAQDAASTLSFARGAGREEEAAEPSMDWVLAESGDPEGCRRVQAYLGRTSQQNLRAIKQAFHAHIEELYKCPDANHVLARLIVESPSPYAAELCAAFQGRVPALAKHKYGSRIVERLLEHSRSVGATDAFLGEIVADSFALGGHRYGNYVVQHVIEHTSIAWQERCILNVLHGIVASSAVSVTVN